MNRHLSILAVLALGACGPGPIATPTNESATAGNAANADGERKVVRKGEVEFRVSDLATAHTFLQQQTTEHDGEVHGDVQDTSGTTMRLRMRVRVPANRFDAFVAAIAAVGELWSRNVDVTDVTAPWLDLEARLAGKGALERRYVELVGRAANIGEVLTVENELGKVRADIESMQAQMRGMRDQVAMSTLTITCVETRLTVTAVSFVASLRRGWDGLLVTITGTLTIWPILLLLSTALLVHLRRRRRPDAAAAAS